MTDSTPPYRSVTGVQSAHEMTTACCGQHPSDCAVSCEASVGQPGWRRPGWSEWARGLHDSYPSTWANAFCPDGEYHRYRKRWYSLWAVCAVCKHRRPY